MALNDKKLAYDKSKDAICQKSFINKLSGELSYGTKRKNRPYKLDHQLCDNLGTLSASHDIGRRIGKLLFKVRTNNLVVCLHVIMNNSLKSQLTCLNIN